MLTMHVFTENHGKQNEREIKMDIQTYKLRESQGPEFNEQRKVTVEFS